MVKINKVVLIGRISKEIELKYIPSSGTATATITIVTDRYNSKTQQKEGDFHSVVLWGKQAESTAQYMRKGSQVAISGRLQSRSYDAKDGTKRYVVEVVADPIGGIEFLGTKGTGNNSNEYSAPTNDNFHNGGDEDITPVDDGDMPF